METDFGGHDAQPGPVVPTRLEGMETGRGWADAVELGFVPTRLEGMETTVVHMLTSNLLKFRPDLRGWKLSS